MMDRVLDWRPRHDPRSRNFPIRAALPRRPKLRDKEWKLGPVLDQLAEGACVTHGWTGEALARPIAVDFSRIGAPEAPRDPQEFAFWAYDRARQIDEWPGEDYSGTSVNAGAKVMRDLGLIREWRWAFGFEDLIDAVLIKGPVVVGSWWRSGMYDAPGGILTPSGEKVGGHCYLVYGTKLNVPQFDGEHGVRVRNSWGPSWGVGGNALIRFSDMATLLADEGEAAIPTRRSFGLSPRATYST